MLKLTENIVQFKKRKGLYTVYKFKNIKRGSNAQYLGLRLHCFNILHGYYIGMLHSLRKHHVVKYRLLQSVLIPVQKVYFSSPMAELGRTQPFNKQKADGMP